MANDNNDLYKDLPTRIDTILGDDYHLHRLRQLVDANAAYCQEHRLDDTKPIVVENFREWLLQRWGVQLTNSDVMGSISGYDVVDEQKFLLFLVAFP